MDYISNTPDLIIHNAISFLAVKDVANIALVSQVFKKASIQYFTELLRKYQLISENPLSDYGRVYAQRCVIIDSWNTESPVHTFLPYNLVKSVKFGIGFVAVLQYNGSLYSNIHSTEMRLLETDVKEHDACMYGLVFQKFSGQVVWFKIDAGGELINIQWAGDAPSVISASFYAILGFESGRVVAFDKSYEREVSFGKASPEAVIEIKSTPKMLLILTAGHKLYSCGLITMEAVLINWMPVRCSAIGTSHSLALIQATVEPVNSWSTETLMSFMQENGFEDCCNIIQHHSIDGTDLESMDDKYFRETLGIREPERRHKLKFLLRLNNQQRYSKRFEIIGWGRNNFSQIGPEGFVINNPVKLPHLDLGEGEDIKELHCDKCFSYVLTSMDRVMALGGKAGGRHDKVVKKSVAWEEINSRLVAKGKIESIESSMNMMGVVYRVEVRNKARVKMRMSEEIFKLISCGKMDVEAYEIGYLDRFLGMLEITFKEFAKTDIPKHRIQYVKRQGKIVWDRRTRVDNF